MTFGRADGVWLTAYCVLRSVPVVVISTEGSQQRIDELRACGIQGYIRKPFTPEQVKEVVDDVLGSKH